MVQGQNLIADIDAAIAANKVMMWSKSSCPHCNMAKQCLQQKGIAFECIELDQLANGAQIQNALATKTGQRTVPNIFAGG